MTKKEGRFLIKCPYCGRRWWIHHFAKYHPEYFMSCKHCHELFWVTSDSEGKPVIKWLTESERRKRIQAFVKHISEDPKYKKRGFILLEEGE